MYCIASQQGILGKYLERLRAQWAVPYESIMGIVICEIPQAGVAWAWAIYGWARVLRCGIGVCKCLRIRMNIHFYSAPSIPSEGTLPKKEKGVDTRDRQPEISQKVIFLRCQCKLPCESSLCILPIVRACPPPYTPTISEEEQPRYQMGHWRHRSTLDWHHTFLYGGLRKCASKETEFWSYRFATW